MPRLTQMANPSTSTSRHHRHPVQGLGHLAGLFLLLAGCLLLPILNGGLGGLLRGRLLWGGRLLGGGCLVLGEVVLQADDLPPAPLFAVLCHAATSFPGPLPCETS